MQMPMLMQILMRLQTQTHKQMPIHMQIQTLMQTRIRILMLKQIHIQMLIHMLMQIPKQMLDPLSMQQLNQDPQVQIFQLRSLSQLFLEVKIALPLENSFLRWLMDSFLEILTFITTQL